MALILSNGNKPFEINIADGSFHTQAGSIADIKALPFSFSSSYGYSAFGNVKNYTSLTVTFNDIGIGVIYGFKSDGSYTKLLSATSNNNPVNVSGYDFVVIELFSNAVFTASVSAS